MRSWSCWRTRPGWFAPASHEFAACSGVTPRHFGTDDELSEVGGVGTVVGKDDDDDVVLGTYQRADLKPRVNPPWPQTVNR